MPLPGGFSGVLCVAARGEAEPATIVRGDGIAADTRFDICSLGKMFTAVAIGRLHEAGAIGDLDDPARPYLPDVPDTLLPGAIRLSDLLGHTSGLGDTFQPRFEPGRRAARSVGELVALVRDERPEFAPGTGVRYSNIAFLLLGAIVERLAGTPYFDHLHAEVFAPAGMDDIRCPWPGEPRPRTAPPVTDEPEDVLPGAGPDGGELATAADLMRFARALQDGRLLEEATRRRLFARRVASVAPGDPGYGLGFTVGERTVGHFGRFFGSSARIEFEPFEPRGLVVLALANRDPPMAEQAVEMQFGGQGAGG